MSERVTFGLDGKVAIITGGSETIGRGIALEYARQGAKVMIAARTQSKMDAVKAEIEAEGGTCATVSVDIRDSQQVEAMVAKSVETFGRVDILVNNAGGAVGIDFKRAPLLELTDQDIMAILDLNIKSLIRASCAAVPQMQKQGSGNIVNIGSMGGVGRGWGGWGPPHMVMYNTTKAAVIHLSRGMSTQWAPEVRVNCINPGFIDSSVIREGRSEEILNNMQKGIGVERFGTPQDVANAAVYLASDASEWLNGMTLDVYGGAKWG